MSQNNALYRASANPALYRLLFILVRPWCGRFLNKKRTRGRLIKKLVINLLIVLMGEGGLRHELSST